jgi:hypothetical protein
MLHQLMTAQIRVHNLDLSEFGLEGEPTIEHSFFPARGAQKP